MKKEEKIDNKIIEYYKEQGLDVIFVNQFIAFIRTWIKRDEKIILVTSSKIARGIFRIRGLHRIDKKTVVQSAIQYFAIKEALLLLVKKRVPVFYYNRVGKVKHGFRYSDSAINRMKSGINFSVMCEDLKKYELDLREIFGERYTMDYVKALSNIPQVIHKGDEYCHEDFSGEFVNVVNGKRLTCYQPEVYLKTIHVYGRCGAFGYAVEDKDTFPSQLQKELINLGYSDIKVVNHGLWGGEDELLNSNFIRDVMDMNENDIIIFYKKHFEEEVMIQFEKNGVWYKDITKEWHKNDIAKYAFFDKPGHMNAQGYSIVAKIVATDLVNHNFMPKEVSKELTDGLKMINLNEYLKGSINTEFNEEINSYIKSILNEYPLDEEIKTCGGIVMNCNPFTKGHRYLAEYASKKVDRLYIFVVEEDKSFFKFEDRLRMVKDGTSDLKNVVVIPSGKFIISSYTFPEYFMKDYVKEKNFDVSMDIEVFGKHIAPALKIKKRFVGEEPFDPVTSNYNMSMQKLLPQYGVSLYEIPRLSIKQGKVVNATEVRRLLNDNNLESIKEYVPKSTFDVLVEKYLKN